jgi:DNA (cytosine-5)-methyltransferase 1
VNATALRPRDILSRIDELLEARYRSAELGNLLDPLAEAIFILISQQTRDAVYRRVFQDLRDALPTWREVMNAPYEQLESILRPAGFQARRASQLTALLTKVDDANAERCVGPYARPPADLTLDFLHDMGDGEAEKFLRDLPGLGPKSARCVLAYSLGRSAFAVDTHVHRIFQRLGVVPSSGRKADMDPFQDAVPPGMRVRLHMNLVHHGRAVCRSQAEKCNECVLVSFCKRGRAAVAEGDDRPVAVDLFAGAGGMGAGFEAAGFRVGLAVERDRNAAQTYRLNHPGVPVLEAEIGSAITGRDLVRYAPTLEDVAVVIGGPPCQGYSAAATRNRSPDDPRNHLYRHAARLAKQLRARTIAIENVPGVRSVRGKGFVESIKEEFQAAGYAVEAHMVRASEFGVPQRRMRFFFLGVRDRRKAAPSAPDPTHRPRVDPRPETEALPLTPSVRDALRPLPALRAGRRDPFARLDDGTEVPNVTTMRHSQRVVRKIAAIPPGGGPISYRRLESDEARTIIAGHRALPVHPRLNRTLSVREAAAIQGFPLTYHFCGPPAAQPLQVANAVPPAVAAGAARVLKPYC